MRGPNANGFAFQWNIGLTITSCLSGFSLSDIEYNPILCNYTFYFI